MIRAAAFIAAFTLSLPAPANAAKNKNTFVYAIVGDVSTLDPHWQYDGVSSFAAEQVYEGLIAYEDLPQIYTIDTVDFRVIRSWVKDFEYNPVMMYGNLYPVFKE